MDRRTGRLATTIAVVVTLSLPCHSARSQSHPHAGGSLGDVDFPVSCDPSLQPAFNRAMSLLHHMTYPEARRVFEEIVKRDPSCAMAHWGIAMTLFQPVWPTRPGPEDLRRGWALVQKARSLAPPTRREQLLIDAAAAFFRDPDSTDYWKRIHAWAAGMERCFDAFRSDPDVAALHALALVATVPADQVASRNNARAAEILTRVLEQNRRHPGAMHYLIHANDAPGREHQSLVVLQWYESIAPDNPHALHMPTHIHTRLGNWSEVVRGNLKAAAAALEQPAGDQGQYVWDEFPHAIEYLVYAWLQTGSDDSAAAQLARLRETPGLEPSFKTAFHIASTQARYALERKAWEEAAAIVPREDVRVEWDRFPWPEAISWFARGLGAARDGSEDDARESLARLTELGSKSAQAGEKLFARNIEILRLGLAGWIARREGENDSAVSSLTQAAELETATPKHPVTPAATLPAYEQLGDLYSELGRRPEAAEAYRKSLQVNPLRLNSLLGAARAFAAMDSVRQADNHYRQLRDVVKGGIRKEILAESEAYLARRSR